MSLPVQFLIAAVSIWLNRKQHRLIEAPARSTTNASVLKRERLGGVLNYYYRDAA